MKILIADDHEMVRKGLKGLLEEQPDFKVVGEARNGREAVLKARELKPDVVIMDFTMPELNGREATRLIRKELPQTEVLILTMHESEELAREIVSAGANGYVLKSQAGNALVEAIHSLAAHKPYFTTRMGAFVFKGYLNQKTCESPALTPREREIVQLIAEGKSNKDVAVALDISTKTAETHRTNIMRKLDLHTAGDLVRYAIRNKLVEP
jgi:DNA-binding NarL/FixJ family response regulator